MSPLIAGVGAVSADPVLARARVFAALNVVLLARVICSWVTVTGLFGPILVILDRFAIGAVLGARAVAIYTVPFQLAQRIQILRGMEVERKKGLAEDLAGISRDEVRA